MSGIVGAFHREGEPIDRDLLGAMTRTLAFRAPDGEQTWCEGPVGLGHALLAVGDEAPPRQPFTLDGDVWITAHARIDAREELAATLGVSLGAASDIELMLRAYLTWGDDFARRILGDFCFGIWDSRSRTMLCGRDPLGVRPLFHALVGSRFLFSNTMQCLQSHPSVSADLDDEGIAEFLLFEQIRAPGVTSFADIRRLPPATILSVTAHRISQRRYWVLPEPELLRYAAPAQYIEHYRDVMGRAVADRLRSRRVSILMSGGLDSTSLAASADHVARDRGLDLELRAFTGVRAHPYLDEEGPLAEAVGAKLGFPVERIAWNSQPLYAGWERPELATPEPFHGPTWIDFRGTLARAGEHSRVVLVGEGGDETLKGASVLALLERLPAIDVASAIAECARMGVNPHWGTGVRGVLGRLRGRARRPDFGFPPWFDHDIEARLNLRERWRDSLAYRDLLLGKGGSGVRREAAWWLRSPTWEKYLGACDAGHSRAKVEVRLPFLDRRVVAFLLALPPLPWCFDKQILREAMRGWLPAEVRRRTKAPVPVDFMRHAGQWSRLVTHVHNAERLVSRYVRVHDLRPPTRGRSLWQDLRPVSLALWLARIQHAGLNVADASRNAIPRQD